MPEDAKWSMGWAKTILLNVNNFTLFEGLIPKFMSKIRALYLIVERLFKDMYKLDLSPEVKVHLTFHVSLLNPFKEHTLWPDRKQMIRQSPNLVGDHLEHEVRGYSQVQEALVTRIKKIPKEYFLKCRGYHKEETAWVATRDMMNAKQLVKHFEKIGARGFKKMKRRH